MTLAEQLYQLHPDLADEQQIISVAYKLAQRELTPETARYYFYYDADFARDFVTEYRSLQRAFWDHVKSADTVEETFDRLFAGI